MGAYTCEYGVVHKICRCREEHTIKCDRPFVHGLVEVYQPKHRDDVPPDSPSKARP
jgi:hypothetical protein